MKAVMRAAFRLPAKEGMARLEKQAEWLVREYPSAAASLREGLAEMFTVTRLGLSASLARCLVSTNVIESPHSGARLPTRQVSRWRDGKMVCAGRRRRCSSPRKTSAALWATKICGCSKRRWVEISNHRRRKRRNMGQARRSTSNGLRDTFGRSHHKLLTGRESEPRPGYEPGQDDKGFSQEGSKRGDPACCPVRKFSESLSHAKE